MCLVHVCSTWILFAPPKKKKTSNFFLSFHLWPWCSVVPSKPPASHLTSVFTLKWKKKTCRNLTLRCRLAPVTTVRFWLQTIWRNYRSDACLSSMFWSNTWNNSPALSLQVHQTQTDTVTRQCNIRVTAPRSQTAGESGDLGRRHWIPDLHQVFPGDQRCFSHSFICSCALNAQTEEFLRNKTEGEKRVLMKRP